MFERRDSSSDNPQIFTISALGKGGKQVTTDGGVFPAWSPAGGKILFVNTVGNEGRELFTIRPDGSNLKRLTTTTESEVSPDWAPDGDRIVFARYEDGGLMGPSTWNVWIADADGSNEVMVAQDAIDPVWSPNGEWVAFEKLDQGIYKVRPDGTDLTLVKLNGSRRFFTPDWQPE